MWSHLRISNSFWVEVLITTNYLKAKQEPKKSFFKKLNSNQGMKLTTSFTSICVWKQAYMLLQNKKTYDVIFEEMSNQMPITSDVANFIIDPNF